MRGVTYNSCWSGWRGTISIDGETYVGYFDTEKRAEMWRVEMEKIKNTYLEPGGVNSRKRVNATHQDLPIGIYESHRTRRGREYYYIRCQINRDTKLLKVITAAFGPTRSRAEALRIVKRRRIEWVRDNAELLKDNTK